MEKFIIVKLMTDFKTEKVEFNDQWEARDAYDEALEDIKVLSVEAYKQETNRWFPANDVIDLDE